MALTDIVAPTGSFGEYSAEMKLSSGSYSSSLTDILFSFVTGSGTTILNSDPVNELVLTQESGYGYM